MTLTMKALEGEKKIAVSVSGLDLQVDIPSGQELFIGEDTCGMLTVRLCEIPCIQDDSVTDSGAEPEEILPHSQPQAPQVEVVSVPDCRKPDSTVHSVQDDHVLFDRLRKLRMQLSKEQNVPPYIIFSDKTLYDMEQKLPLDLEAFGKISGVGETKRLTLGNRFLEVIGQFVKETQVA